MELFASIERNRIADPRDAISLIPAEVPVVAFGVAGDGGGTVVFVEYAQVLVDR